MDDSFSASGRYYNDDASGDAYFTKDWMQPHFDARNFEMGSGSKLKIMGGGTIKIKQNKN